MGCGVGRRHGSDPELLWLWRRPAATDPIRPLAWEPPYAVGAGPEKAKRQKKKLKTKVVFQGNPMINGLFSLVMEFFKLKYS